MKLAGRFILSFCLFIFPSIAVFADVMPLYTGALQKGIIGFFYLPQKFNVYLYPRVDSQILDTVEWNNIEVKYKDAKLEPAELFAVQIPSKNYAFCMVVDEQDDWYKIIYNKEKNKSGWVKPEKDDDFWGLRDFYSFYGRKHGLGYMKNIDYHQRGIYSGAYDGSQKLGGFTLIKNIRLNKISGNWALVTVVDFDNKLKIGYIRWREDDGQIIIFPRMDK